MSKEINLLPLPRRRQLARRFFEHTLRRFCTSLLWGLLLLSAVGVTVFTGLQLATSWLYPSAETALEQAVIDYRSETRLIQEQNTLIAAMQSHHDERLEWSTLLPDIFAVFPAGTEITHLSGDREGHRLTLQGRASARSALAVLENKFKTLPWVKSVEAPRTNLLERVAPEFTFTLGL